MYAVQSSSSKFLRNCLLQYRQCMVMICDYWLRHTAHTLTCRTWNWNGQVLSRRMAWDFVCQVSFCRASYTGFIGKTTPTHLQSSHIAVCGIRWCWLDQTNVVVSFDVSKVSSVKKVCRGGHGTFYLLIYFGFVWCMRCRQSISDSFFSIVSYQVKPRRLSPISSWSQPCVWQALHLLVSKLQFKHLPIFNLESTLNSLFLMLSSCWPLYASKLFIVHGQVWLV